MEITIRNAANWNKEETYLFPVLETEMDAIKKELAAPWQVEAEELMVVDYEEFGFYKIFGEFPDLDILSDVLDNMPEDWTAEMFEFAIEADSTGFDPDNFIFYNADSMEEFGEEITKDWDIPDYLTRYLDYEKITRDYMLDTYGTLVNGKRGYRYYMEYIG